MAEGTGDLTESKARNPRLRAEPTSDTPCPPRGPHHPVLTAVLSLSLPPCIPSFSLYLLHSISFVRARARACISRCALAAFCSLVPVLVPRSPSCLRHVDAPRPSPRARSPSGRPQFAVSTASLPSRRADLPLRRLPGVAARALRHGCEVMSAGLAEKRKKQSRNRGHGTATSDGGGFSRGNRKLNAWLYQ